MEENELFNFSGLRLDWYRLQAYTSVAKSSFMIRDHRDLAKHMNTIIFHAKMVDFLDELLVETSNLSIYWLVVAFYKVMFSHKTQLIKFLCSNMLFVGVLMFF